jgi:hypothetical protein
MADEAAESTQLTTASDNANFGKALIEKAEANRRERNAERVVGLIDSEIESINVAERKIAFYQACRDKSKARLRAIEDGDFTITNSAFTFNDADLAKGPTLNEGPLIDEIGIFSGITTALEVRDRILGGAAGGGKSARIR